MTGDLCVGTSGWSYETWRGDFYPADLPASRRLEHYAGRFDAVEVNHTFYRLPNERNLRAWRDRTPDGFRFVLKGSRYVTHTKKLRDAATHVPKLLRRLPALGAKAALLLWQLPPSWSYDGERLASFLAALPEEPPSAIEFRDASWVNDEARGLLEDARVAFVVHDHADLATPDWTTADRVYLRFHGPRGDYRGGYSEDALLHWRRKAAGWRGHGRDVWAFFNNDADGRAPWDALTFRGGPPAVLPGARAPA